jgi:HlyD family secretion protein
LPFLSKKAIIKTKKIIKFLFFMLKKIFNKITVSGLLIIITGGGAYFYFAGKKTAPEYTTVAVKRGQLTQSVDATGKVESAERINLNFKTTGRISQITVKAGDKVSAGQILARLESRALQSQITDAEARLNQAEADYDKLLAGASQEDLQVTEKTVSQKSEDLAAAENALATLQTKRDTELANFKNAVLDAFDSENVVVKTAINEIDNTLSDPDAENTLGAKNGNAILTVKKSKQTASDYLVSFSTAVSPLSSSAPDEDIISIIKQAKELLNLTNTALTDTLGVLAATVTSYDLTEADLNTLKDNIFAQQTKISAARTDIQTAAANWTNKITYYEDLVKAAQDAISQAQVATQVASSQLDLKKAPPRQFEINMQKAKIAQAQAALGLAVANLEETIIRAPLIGTITKKNFTVGEQNNLSEPVLEMIGNAKMEIEVDIPESDISKIKTGQQAEINLDAFSSDLKFSGVVSFIDPAETLIQDVVYYKMKIQLTEDYEEIKPGMTANVVIFTAQKDNVLSIPFRAVKSRNGDKYAEILVNGQPQERIVQLGLRGDDGVEIIAGLNEGDEVITFVKE